jgi:hypothetical protein
MTTASQDLDETCKHDITRRFCSLCNGLEDLQRRERDLEVERVLALGEWFSAKYGGRCAKCNTRYEPGCPIRRKTQLERTSPNESRWVAMCCAPEEEE